MIRRAIFFIGLTSLFFISCHSILFNEDEGKREIFLPNFKSIQIQGIFNIVLIQDSANSIIITGKNNIRSVNASVKDDLLVISDDGKINFNPAKNTLSIHFTSLDSLVTCDAVNVSCEGTLRIKNFSFNVLGEIAEVRLALNCNFPQLVNSGNTLGNFYLSGKAEDCYFFNRYGSRIFADSLICSNATIINESVGNVRVNASDHLTAYIKGPGNIFYYGKPFIEIAEKIGDGKMISLPI